MTTYQTAQAAPETAQAAPEAATAVPEAAQTAPGAEAPARVVDADLPASLTSAGDSVLEWIRQFWTMAITPGWRQYQLLILVALMAVSHVLGRVTRNRLDSWIRAQEGLQKWQLRAFIQLRDRLTLVYFVALSWSLYWTMQYVTWPSRSRIIGVFATLALAWLVIGLGARLVRNRTLRRIVKWSLWIYATLVALGLLDEAIVFLDEFSVTIGSMRLSLLVVIKATLLIAAMLTGARLIVQTANTNLRRNEDISPSMQVLAVKAIQLVLYGFVVLFGVQALGFDLSGLAILSGAIGVGIGFGLQKVVSNLVSGVIILLDRSVKPGDVISLGDTFGWIDSLGGRYVSVVTRDGKEFLIPNEDLITGQVVNWTHSNDWVRLDLEFGVSYSDDPHLVRKVAIKACSTVPRVRVQPNPPVCHITGFGDSSVDYVLRFWIMDIKEGVTNVRGDVYLALWDAFHAQGIRIPFPQREVRMLEGSAPTPEQDRPARP